MNKMRDIFEIGGNGIMYVLSATQTKEVFEIISLVLSIIISILIIVSKMITWYQNAMKDGKITSDEIKDGIDTLVDGVDEIKDKIEDKEEKKE